MAWTQTRHLTVTLAVVVFFAVIGSLYATSVVKTQQASGIFDQGFASYAPDGLRIVAATFQVSIDLPLGVLSATYPVDVAIRLTLEYSSSYDGDRTFFVWYQHLELDGVRTYDSESGSWIEVNYERGERVITVRRSMLFHYEGPYMFGLVEKGNFSDFQIVGTDWDHARVITANSAEAGAAQYFNNLVAGLGLASAGFAGVPLISNMVWRLIEARRVGKKPEEPPEREQTNTEVYLSGEPPEK